MELSNIVIGSIVSLVLFYLFVIFVGVASAIWFRRKFKVNGNNISFQIVAGRKLGSVVGWLTMSATMVGGGFLNGTAEMVALDGLVWTIPPFGICVGLTIAGLVFAPTMRRRKYYTMLDPLEEKFGAFVTSCIYLSSLFGDILWSASILAALGTSLHIIVGLSVTLAVIVSAAVAVIYTLIGQMISVAYTDIIELIFLTVGLAVVTPYVLTNEDVQKGISDSVSQSSNTTDYTPWLGTIETYKCAFWTDLAIAMTLGSIPWQSYFQRVLSVSSVGDAKRLSIFAGLSALVFAVPPICMGIAGSTVDWESTGLNESVYSDKSLTLPLVVQQFTPPVVSVIGLSAIAAAVMSSTDSAILGSSSMFTHNVYKKMRPKATDMELSIALKLCICVIGVVSSVIALISPSITISGLFILAADIVFVATLPQLICALYIPICNGYGAFIGYLLSLVLRLLAGDYLLGIPTIIKYPFYRADIDLQLFPFRTFAMISSILVSVLFSFLAKVTLTRLSKGWDVLRLVHPHWLKLRTELRKSELSTPPVDEKNILESAETFTHL